VDVEVGSRGRQACRVTLGAMTLSIMALTSSCGRGSGLPPPGPPVPGTSAFVNGRQFAPLHVGEVLGTLRRVGGGCQGSFGSGYDGTASQGPDIALATDKDCRVYVESITFGETEPPLPPDGTFMTPVEAPSASSTP
jgi:hypothetical protein